MLQNCSELVKKLHPRAPVVRLVILFEYKVLLKIPGFLTKKHMLPYINEPNFLFCWIILVRLSYYGLANENLCH